jgi:hypothetical protein
MLVAQTVSFLSRDSQVSDGTVMASSESCRSGSPLSFRPSCNEIELLVDFCRSDRASWSLWLWPVWSSAKMLCGRVFSKEFDGMGCGGVW